MPILNTPRAGRQNLDYMEKLIANMYADRRSIFRQGYGVLNDTPKGIIESFLFVQNNYQLKSLIRVHCIEVLLEKDMEIAMVLNVAEQIGQYFFLQGFQCLVCVVYVGDYYMIAIAVNAYAYNRNKRFHDNNASYIELCHFLRQIVPRKWDIKATENTFSTLRKWMEIMSMGFMYNTGRRTAKEQPLQLL